MNLRWRSACGVFSFVSWMARFAMLAGLLSLSACGVKSTSAATPIEQPPATPGPGTAVPVLLTLTDDASSNGIVSFYANISQVQITPRNGGASTLYAANSDIEISHLAGTTQYLTMTSVSPDSYKNILVTVSDPLVTYIDKTGATVTKEFPDVTGTAEFDFPELLKVDTTPLELTLDFDLEKSVVLDNAAGTLTLTPTFSATALPLTTGTPTIGTGVLEGVLATVGKYASGVLTLNTDVAQFAMSCNITGATRTVNYSASAGLPQGSLVRVDMVGQRDSSINCTRVEAVNVSNVGYALAGTVNSFRGGLAPYQMTLAMQEGTGAGVSPTFWGGGINANFDSGAAFAIDWDGMDQTNLGFTPNFDPVTFFAGQYVEASSAVPLLTTGNDIGAIPGSMKTVAAMNAAQMTLRKQQEEGTVSQVSTDLSGVSRFTMTVAANSVFAQYTALPVEPVGFVPTITVVVPASVTVNGSLTTPIAGAPAGSSPYVKVRGLLFFSDGKYLMVAQRVTATLPPPVAVPAQ